MHICTIIIILLFTAIKSVTGQAQKSFSAKDIESKMAKVNDSLYAARFETTNREYGFFLSEIRAADPALYAIAAMDTSEWKIEYPAYHFQTSGYTSSPEFREYPACNMRHEGAFAYCKWLTEKYNTDPKRKFGKVVFMLPDQNQWIEAAKGERKQALYPWGNYYMVNKKGYFMCNFKPVGDPYHIRDSMGKPAIVNYSGPVTLHDAAFEEEKQFHTMHVKSFQPNDFGLYNVCGNVAEMSIEKGIAFGGSWNSYGGEINLLAKKNYIYPSPEAGFRVFMIITER